MLTNMWTKSKSAFLTLICTRILIGVIIAIAIAMPLGTAFGFYGVNTLGPAGRVLFVGIPTETLRAIFLCAYACFVFAMIALFSLDLLLRNIRKDEVFTRVNVKYLRIISWCCFGVAVAAFCGWSSIHIVLIFVAAAAAFFGLLMRVVKNVIDAACEIKDENDFTI